MIYNSKIFIFTIFLFLLLANVIPTKCETEQMKEGDTEWEKVMQKCNETYNIQLGKLLKFSI